MGFKPRRDAAPHRFRARIIKDDTTQGRAIQLPFDPKASFGAARAPVVVKVGRGSFRTTTAKMAGLRFIPFSRKHREQTGVEDAEFVDVTVSYDHEPRTIKAPRDLATRLREEELKEVWDRVSYTHQREYVEAIESARKPETRERRVTRTIASLQKM